MESRSHSIVADDIVEAMAAGGVDTLFFTSGSDITFYQEAFTRRYAQGLETPRLVSMIHEIPSLNAALGYTAISGRPSATAAHVDVGTLNYGAGLHSAARSRLPVLLTAGTPPIAMPGTMAGARDGAHFWTQQVPDQNGIVRQYVKWEHRLEYQDNPGTTVSRALQVAQSDPQGPVYLSIPREVAMMPADGRGFISTPELGIASAGAPTSDDIDWLLERLVGATNPYLVLGRGGKTAASWDALNRFAEFFGCTVVDGAVLNYQAVAFDHPLYLRSADLSDADLVIIFESDIPWMPGPRAPKPGTDIAFVDPDAVTTELRIVEFPASIRIPSDTVQTAAALTRHAQASLTREQLAAFARRREAIVERVRNEVRRYSADAAAARRDDIIDPVWASAVVGEWLSERDVVVMDDTIKSAPVRRYLTLHGPQQYIRHPSTAGGWGPGASLGAKLACPDKNIVLISGEGFYMFGVPHAALWAAREYGAPYLTILFQNNSYNVGTLETIRHFPDGYAVHAGLPGGYLPQPPDFAADCTAIGGYGENVSDPALLRDALNRGYDAVQGGKCAVIAIQLPRLES